MTTSQGALDGSGTGIDVAASVEKRCDGLQGSVHAPGDAQYEDSRTLWNGMIDRRPAAVIQPCGVADIQQAVAAARELDLEITVRGGGHNSAGLAVSDGGLQIHLTRMRGVHVDPVRRIARVQAGATWGDYDRETHVHGLASTGGAVSTTGVAGLTLGGGIGLLMRKYGLTIDHLEGIEVVTADSRVVRASATENEDLFWAVRGGGGNFGVATYFDFRLHELGNILSGFVYHPMEGAARTLRDVRDLAAEFPDSILTIPALGSTPDGDPVLLIEAVHCGDPAEGEQLLKPLRSAGNPMHDDIAYQPYPKMQSAINEMFPFGIHTYWRSHLLRGLPDEAIDLIVEWAARPSSPLNMILIEQMGGAVARVAPEDTVFEYRDAAWNVVLLGRWTNPADPDRDEHIQWVRSLHDALQPWAYGTYVNYLGIGESADRIKTAYPAKKWDRLVAVKDKYDPDNIFHRNQNIPPSTR